MWLLIVPAKLLKYFVIIIVNRYSCAIFDEEAGRDTGDLLSTRPIAPPEGSLDGPDDLERGQIAKLRRVAERARLRPGCRVLELGCGWVSFAMLAARDYGAKVDTITIALEQVDFARESIAKAGLSDFITVHYVDYRKLPSSFHHTFDAVVSTGVMEHSMSNFLRHTAEGFDLISHTLNSRDRVHDWLVQGDELGHEAGKLIQGVHDEHRP